MAYKKKLNTQDRHLPKMHVKKGDKVVVVAGSYKDR
ncbi:MAG: 50S ribosomal protein L24, partial [Saprospiraceae bacterium]|nr:50S ribosomal protein L24 [Saprospiraceae bacterium]